MMEDKSRCAVITGAGRGIGKAIALDFADKGICVALMDFDGAAVSLVADTISAHGGRAISLPADVSNRNQVFASAQKAEDAFGQIDIWINCAGYSRIIPFLDCTEEILNRTMDVNLKGTFFCCQAAVTHMICSGGNIVNFSSQSGKKGTNNYEAYCASKFAIRGLTQSIAVEFAPQKIRCNCICPSVILTPMWNAQLSDYARKRHIRDEDVMPRFVSNTPLGRLCTYEDVTGLVSFLISEDSSYITGQSLNLTGGGCMY